MKVVVTRTLKNIVKMQYKEDTLYVLANFFVTQKKLKMLIAENYSWINSRREAERQVPQAEIKRTIEDVAPPNRSVEDQQLIKDFFAVKKTMILGDIVNVSPSMTNKTYLDGNTLYVSEKNYSDKATRLKAIKAYLRKMALLYVASEISSYGSGASLCPLKIEFKDVPDSWSKCSNAAQKILTFDYRITQLPLNLRTYIIAHAFAHFQYPTHNNEFWNYMSNVLPRYKDSITQLEAYDFLKDL